LEKIFLTVSCAFGLESVIKRELQELGIEVRGVRDGRIDVRGYPVDIARANINLRAADRVFLNVGNCPGDNFDMLFNGVSLIPWENWILSDARIDVVARSIKSQTRSERTIQSMVKKSLLRRLATAYGSDHFPENNGRVEVGCDIIHNQATFYLDTSGAGLNQRGYRIHTGEAPLRETLAAGLVYLSLWQPKQVLIDPMCGSGTIVIEAALIAKKRAPGLRRRFAAEQWRFPEMNVWESGKNEAIQRILPDRDLETSIKIFGFDHDPLRVQDAKENARRAGVGTLIQFECLDLNDITLSEKNGVLITNPPYGIKLGEAQYLPALYQKLGVLCANLDGFSLNIITADRSFPSQFLPNHRYRARKLYNGNIRADLYHYDSMPR
jgi:putative N6-adenine-specific DNA methylase